MNIIIIKQKSSSPSEVKVFTIDKLHGSGRINDILWCIINLKKKHFGHLEYVNNCIMYSKMLQERLDINL